MSENSHCPLCGSEYTKDNIQWYGQPGPFCNHCYGKGWEERLGVNKMKNNRVWVGTECCPECESALEIFDEGGRFDLSAPKETDYELRPKPPANKAFGICYRAVCDISEMSPLAASQLLFDLIDQGLVDKKEEYLRLKREFDETNRQPSKSSKRRA